MKLKNLIKPNLTGALMTGAGWLTGGVPGAIIGGALGTVYHNYDKEATKKKNAMAQQQALKENQLARENWDITNAYNSPKDQMRRLAEAGLNPNLVYGSGNVTGNTASSLSADNVALNEVFNTNDSIVKSLPVLQGFANLRNTNTQNELLQYQMGQTQAQADHIKAQTRDLNNFLNGSGRSTYNSVGLFGRTDAWSNTGNKVSDSDVGKLVKNVLKDGKNAGNFFDILSSDIAANKHDKAVLASFLKEQARVRDERINERTKRFFKRY